MSGKQKYKKNLEGGAEKKRKHGTEGSKLKYQLL